MKHSRICLIVLLAASCRLSAAPNPLVSEKTEFAIQGKYSLSSCLAELRRKFGLSYVARLGDERAVDLNLHAADWDGLLQGVAAAYNVAGFAWGDLWLLDATERPTPVDVYSDYDKVLADMLPPKTPAAKEGDLAKAQELLARQWQEAARQAKLPKREYALRTSPVSDPTVRTAVLSQFREQQHLKTTPSQILRHNSLERLRKYLPDSWLAFVPKNRHFYLCVPEPGSQVNICLGVLGVSHPLPEGYSGLPPRRHNFPDFVLPLALKAPRGGVVATKISLAGLGPLAEQLTTLSEAAQLKVACEDSAGKNGNVAVAVDPLPASAILDALSIVCALPWGPWRVTDTYTFGGNTVDTWSRLFQASPLRHRLWLMRCVSMVDVRLLAEFPWHYLSQTQRQSLRRGGKVPYADIPPRCWEWVRRIGESQALWMLWGAVRDVVRSRADEKVSAQLMSLGRGQKLLYSVALEPLSGRCVVLTNRLPRATRSEVRATTEFLRRIGFNHSYSATAMSQPWFWKVTDFQSRLFNSKQGSIRLLYKPEVSQHSERR